MYKLRNLRKTNNNLYIELEQHTDSTQKTINSLGSDTIFMRISPSAGDPIKYTAPDGRRFDTAGLNDEQKIRFNEALNKITENNTSKDIFFGIAASKVV
jgi:hypothetical protein